MDSDLARRQSTYFSSCMASPSWFPLGNDHSRFHLLSRGSSSKGRRWRNLLRKLVRESKTIYRSKPLTFQYDLVSYSQNFDDGCKHDDLSRPPRVVEEVRWDASQCKKRC